MNDQKPRVPIAVVVPVLARRTRTPAQGGPVAYPVPGIRFVQDQSMFGHALSSVADQTVEAAGGINVALDDERAGRHGAGATRGAALRQALDSLRRQYGDEHPDTTFVSFLDDDDLWYPHHLETHYRLLVEGDGADVAYSFFNGNEIGVGDLAWAITHKGRAWDPAEPHHTTMCITVRSSFAERAVDQFDGEDMHPEWSGEDWRFILKLNELGARFKGTGDVTFHYRVHQGNTSGLSTQGDAIHG